MPTLAREKFFKSSPEENDPAAAIENVHLRALGDMEREYARKLMTLGDKAPDDPDCELLRLQIELAKAEYDRAGALKFKSFVRHNRVFFEARKDGPTVERKETKDGAAYVAPPELANRRYLFVNMGELDRLNKEGHNQAAGDAGLEAVVRAVSRVGGEMADGVSVYRYSGNDYLVEFKDITDADLAAFERELLNTELDLGDFRHLDAPPLSTVRLSFNEVLDVMSSADLAATEGEERDAYEAAAESVSVMSRFADYNLAMETFATRVARAVEKLTEANNGKIGRAEAESFFDTYLKKGFSGSGLDALASIEDLWREGNDPVDFNRAVGFLAAEATKARFAEDREFELYERHLANGLVYDYLRTMDARELGRSHAEAAVANLRLAKIPNAQNGTSGLRELSRRRERIGRRGGKWDEVDRVAYAAEAAKRDSGTGLMERGAFFEELGRRIESKDKLGVVFIDLGFLKYFNDAGRRAVGDAALLKAAEIMENALAESGVEGELYRYGGDEFTVLVKGGREDASLVRKAVDRLRKEAGRIPDLRSLREQGLAKDTIGDSRADYVPMELVFNFGIADGRDIDELVKDIGEEELGAALAKSRRSVGEFKADLLVKLADASVGYQKAVSRFHDLLRLMDQNDYKDKDSLAHKRTEAVIAASRKAIFAGLGGEAALRFWAEGQHAEDPAVLNDQINRFVADRIEKMETIVKGRGELIDKLVEIHAARNRLKTEVAVLESRLAKDGVLAKRDKEHINELEMRLAEAQKAREAIIAARQNIAGGGG